MFNNKFNWGVLRAPLVKSVTFSEVLALFLGADRNPKLYGSDLMDLNSPDFHLLLRVGDDFASYFERNALLKSPFQGETGSNDFEYLDKVIEESVDCTSTRIDGWYPVICIGDDMSDLCEIALDGGFKIGLTNRFSNTLHEYAALKCFLGAFTRVSARWESFHGVGSLFERMAVKAMFQQFRNMVRSDSPLSLVAFGHLTGVMMKRIEEALPHEYGIDLLTAIRLLEVTELNGDVPAVWQRSTSFEFQRTLVHAWYRHAVSTAVDHFNLFAVGVKPSAAALRPVVEYFEACRAHNLSPSSVAAGLQVAGVHPKAIFRVIEAMSPDHSHYVQFIGDFTDKGWPVKLDLEWRDNFFTCDATGFGWRERKQLVDMACCLPRFINFLSTVGDVPMLLNKFVAAALLA